MASKYSSALPVACAAVGGVAIGACCVLAAKAAWSRPVKLGRRHFLGIDIGGTTISVGLVDDFGTILGAVQVGELGEDHTPGVIVKRIANLVRDALLSAGRSLKDVTAVGVCSPGLCDFDRGVVKAAANLRGWEEVPLVDLLANHLGMNRKLVCLENDGNTALLAEVWVGAAKGKRDVVLLTLGTGIGAGIFSGGRLVRGHLGQAGELGHAILVPEGRTHGSTGVKGIFEAYASATAVVARAVEAGIPESSSLYKALSDLSCEKIFQHAADGDDYAAQVVDETAKYLAIGCINCARSYDPEIILFTGGMSQAGEQLMSLVRKQFARHHWNIAPVTLELRVAAAPLHAGLIGAAYAARSVASKGSD